MSILIKGMEMPENCICCDLSHEDSWCPAKQTYVDRYSYDTCPLIPVPDHGRLIDADKLIDRVIAKYLEHERKKELVFTAAEIKQDICDLIADAPTIIPADPAEEGKT